VTKFYKQKPFVFPRHSLKQNWFGPKPQSSRSIEIILRLNEEDLVEHENDNDQRAYPSARNNINSIFGMVECLHHGNES
jgi:hypothetical protein